MTHGVVAIGICRFFRIQAAVFVAIYSLRSIDGNSVFPIMKKSFINVLTLFFCFGINAIKFLLKKKSLLKVQFLDVMINPLEPQ